MILTYTWRAISSSVLAFGVLSGVHGEESSVSKSEPGAGTEIQCKDLVTGFECSWPRNAEYLGSNHYVMVQDGRNWFMVRFTGVKGKTVRVDLKGLNPGHWGSVNPVFAYTKDPNDPSLYGTTSAPDTNKTMQARNKSRLPDTDGQKWKFISKVWMEDIPRTPEKSVTPDPEKTKESFKDVRYCFEQTFEADDVIVAMRYPYTPDYRDKYFMTLRNRIRTSKLEDVVQVHEIGKSAEGRMLQVVTIGEGGESGFGTKPCLVLYGHEDGTEPDGSWVCEGAIEFLVSSTPEAREVRKAITVIVIPLLDPDATVNTKYKGMCSTFSNLKKTPESIAYADWFKKWTDAGNRLDLVVDLHNVEGGQVKWHGFCLMKDPSYKRYEVQEQYVAQLLKPMLAAKGIGLSKEIGGSGMAMTRMVGYLAAFYGPIFVGVELNCQASGKHLVLAELRDMGRIFCIAAAKLFETEQGRFLCRSATEKRQEHDQWAKNYQPATQRKEDALDFEWHALRFAAAQDANNQEKLLLSCFDGTPSVQQLHDRLTDLLPIADETIIEDDVKYWLAVCLVRMSREREALGILQSTKGRHRLVCHSVMPFGPAVQKNSELSKTIDEYLNLGRYYHESLDFRRLLMSEIHAKLGDRQKQWSVLQELRQKGDNEEGRRRPREKTVQYMATRESDKKFLDGLRKQFPATRFVVDKGTLNQRDPGEITKTRLRLIGGEIIESNAPEILAFRYPRLLGMLTQVKLLATGWRPEEMKRQEDVDKERTTIVQEIFSVYGEYLTDEERTALDGKYSGETKL